MIQDRLSYEVSQKTHGKYYKDSRDRAIARAKKWQREHPQEVEIYRQRAKELHITGRYLTPLPGKEAENHGKQWIFRKDRGSKEVEQ